MGLRYALLLIFALLWGFPAYGQFKELTESTASGSVAPNVLDRRRQRLAVAWTPATALDAVAAYDPGDTTTLIKGGYDLDGSTQYFSRTTGAIPAAPSGTPAYPISAVCWLKTDTIGATVSEVLEFSDAANNERLVLYRNTASMVVYSADGGVQSSATTAASLVAGRWHCVIAVWASASSRSIYLDTDTTGATEGTARTVTGIDRLYVGRHTTSASYWDGVLAYTAILPVDLSGAGNATIRQNIFNGADPEAASSTTATALYKFDNDAGADAKGSFDLTASGSPTAQNNLVVMRDLVGTYHQRATTSAPTYDATLFTNRGGITFTAASSQFLVCESTPIAAAPLQAYAVFRTPASLVTSNLVSFNNSANDTDYWTLQASSLLRWYANGVSAATAASSIATSTTYLLWGMETSSTSRAARVNGGTEATDTTSATPTGANRLTLGVFNGATKSAYSDGSFGAAWVLNSTDVSERADVHAWVDTNFGTSLP